MKVLVTGGTGFIGRHLVEYLLEKDLDVTILDNFSNSENKSMHKFGSTNVKIIEGDITNIQNLIDVTEGQDVVVHLAAKISVDDSIKNPSETFRVNVDGTKNVLVACEKNNVSKVVIASSAAVYGESPPNVKLTENSEKNPISPYGESKSLMEQNVMEFVSNHNIKCIILRFFNIYGIGQSSEYAGVITKFIEKMFLNKPLDIFGDGLQTRDFVSVKDVVNAIYNAMEHRESGIFNIASGKAVTIKELAKFMISLSGKNLDIKYLPPKKGEIRYSEADISLARKELNYSPKYDLKEIKNLLK